MRYLLDTRTFLWLATDDERLSASARRRTADMRNTLLLSVVSLWEIAIKTSLGKLEIPGGARVFVANQVEALQADVLPFRADHALGVEALPFHHRDPFDRALISVAIIEDLPILSVDTRLDDYPVERAW